MNRYLVALFWLLCCGVASYAKKQRHVVYWNSLMTPELSSSDFVMNVKIGQFMDILCPQTSLLGITQGNNHVKKFDIYNVTQDQYERCEIGEKRNLIFSCNKPERENKLTIKFQLISPSPLGFRFQYCEDYYFVAQPKNAESGCRKEATRLKISVECKETQPKTTSLTKFPTSTYPEKHDDFLHKILHAHVEHRLDEKDHETILLPKLIQLESREMHVSENSPKILASTSNDLTSGRGGASSLLQSTNLVGLLAIAISAIVFSQLHLNC